MMTDQFAVVYGGLLRTVFVSKAKYSILIIEIVVLGGFIGFIRRGSLMSFLFGRLT